MKKYGVKYFETYQKWYEVRANSPEEAKEKLLNAIMEGKEKGPDECINSGCEEAAEILEPEVKNIDLNRFLENFNREYEDLYGRSDYVAGYDEAVCAFDDFCKSHSEFVSEFVRKRGDFISSDREAAAFMFALDALT